MEDCSAVPPRNRQYGSGTFRGRTDDKHRVGARELRLQRCAQRTRREDAAIADGAPSIDHQNRKVFSERRVLKTVVHHNRIRAVTLRGAGAREAVARDNGRRKFGQEQRLVADVGGAMNRTIDAHRTGETAAITASQKEWAFVLGKQKPPDGERRRRLAGAADREVAHANDRDANFLAR